MFAIVGRGGDQNGNGENTLVPGTNGRVTEHTCYICDAMGHIPWYCPVADNTRPQERNSSRNLNCAQVASTQKASRMISDWIINPT